MSFGVEKPAGFNGSRAYTLSPIGNSDEAEAAQAALTVYANKLKESDLPPTRKKGELILEWIEKEIAFAENMQMVGELMNNGAGYERGA